MVHKRAVVVFLRFRQLTSCFQESHLGFPGRAVLASEAPHLGVSAGGVEVEGTVFVRASLTGNGSPW